MSAADDSGASRDELRRAADTMRAVRERCVWSQRITHEDLVPYLVEESAELIDAVEVGSRADLREELGDLLWQVLFHAAVAAEDPDDPFTIDDVAAGLADKMVRRHPHVFGDAVATTPDEVLVHWNAAKAAEKHSRRSVLDGVSPHMPSLALAQKLLGKAAQVGVTRPAAALPLPAPAAPAPAAPAPPLTARHHGGAETPDVDPRLGAETVSRGEAEDELGDALLALVATARERGWDAERALRGAIRRLEGDVRAAEAPAPPGDLEQ